MPKHQINGGTDEDIRRGSSGASCGWRTELGLVGIAHFDLVAAIFGMKFGETSLISSVVYALVGLSALYQAVSFKVIQHRWAHESTVARAR